MSSKRDRSTPRTTGDIERKYGQKIKNTEEEVKTQSKSLDSLIIKVNELKTNIDTINNEIEEINQIYKELETSIEGINGQVKNNTKLRHSHNNKSVLDKITQEDINKWNNSFNGDYILLAENVQVNQTIEDIDGYNLILLQLENVNRYIPCFRYESLYKGIIITKDGSIDMEEISIEFENKKVINIECTNNILEIIGIF